jgi:hypothetical protein
MLTIAVSSYRYQTRRTDDPLRTRLMELARGKAALWVSAVACAAATLWRTREPRQARAWVYREAELSIRRKKCKHARKHPCCSAICGWSQTNVEECSAVATRRQFPSAAPFTDPKRTCKRCSTTALQPTSTGSRRWCCHLPADCTPSSSAQGPGSRRNIHCCHPQRSRCPPSTP